MTEPIGPGAFVAVVGASGVGKDALLSYAREQSGLSYARLSGAGEHPGERVGHREPEVVVAVDGEDDVAQAGDELVEPLQERGELVRHRVADGVGDVDRGRTLLEGDRAHLGGELDLRARGIHRRELDVLAQRAGVGDGRARLTEHVRARALQLVDDVDVRRGDEGVDPRSLRVAHRVPRRVDAAICGGSRRFKRGGLSRAGPDGKLMAISYERIRGYSRQ